MSKLKLFSIEAGVLQNGEKSKVLIELESGKLGKEEYIKSWIEENSDLLGVDITIIGKEVPTGYGRHAKRIDLLALDTEGNLVVIELKKGKTPRDVVAQALDYAQWAESLTEEKIKEIAIEEHLKDKWDSFRKSLPKGELNTSIRVFIVASSLDPQTERIVKYLFEKYNVPLNTMFFNIFEKNGKQFLAINFLLDNDEVKAAATGVPKLPWSGYYYANTTKERDWEHQRKHGYFCAGGRPWYSKRLNRFEVGNKFFLYFKQEGYVGYGEVIGLKKLLSKIKDKTGNLVVKSSDFDFSFYEFNSFKKLEDQEKEKPDDAEYAVEVKWHRTFKKKKAKTFAGVFANQNIVCELSEGKTFDFLKKEFKVKEPKIKASD